MRHSTFIFSLTVAILSGSAFAEPLDAKKLFDEAQLSFKPLAVTPVANESLQTARAELGRRLFFENRVSEDGNVSCSHCHLPDKQATDGLNTYMSKLPAGTNLRRHWSGLGSIQEAMSQLRGGDVARRQPRRAALQDLAELEGLDDVPSGEADDRRAPVGFAEDQPFGHQARDLGAAERPEPVQRPEHGDLVALPDPAGRGRGESRVGQGWRRVQGEALVARRRNASARFRSMKALACAASGMLSVQVSRQIAQAIDSASSTIAPENDSNVMSFW